MEHPHVIVLFGATGDLARRKLLPGLLHLTRWRLACSRSRIVGTRPCETDRRGFRQARPPRLRRVRRAGTLSDCCSGRTSRRGSRFVPTSAGPQALADARARGGEGDSGGRRERRTAAALPQRPAEGGARRDPAARRRRAGRAVADHHGEAVRHRPRRLRRRSNDLLHRGLRRGARSSASTTSSARRRRRTSWPSGSRNGLFEPIWNRNYIDHVQIDVPETLGLDDRAAFYEATGAFRTWWSPTCCRCSRSWRWSRRRRSPPGRSATRRTRSSGPCGRSSRTRWCAGSTTATATSPASADDSDTETFVALQGRDRQLALGGCAVLPAHRQEAGRGRADHLDRVQGAAADDVPGRLERRHPGPRPPHLRPGRPVEDVAVVLRQAARAGHEAREAVDAVRDPRDRPSSRGARGLRAADPRRDARRPHAVHHGRRHRDAVGEVRRRCSSSPPPVRPTARAAGARTRSTS